ncbi:MAG: hypothetical protein PVSMB7_29140 [Chloroflexota bacterium]
MICSQCGTQNKAGDRYCEQCGSPLDVNDAVESATNGNAVTGPGAVPGTLVRLDGAQDSYTLRSRTVIGRLDTCDLPVDDRSVSREHARLSRLHDGYVVEDLGSTNGTLVNGRRIDEAVILRPGDILTVGSVEFRFQQQSALSESRQSQLLPAWASAALGRERVDAHAGGPPALEERAPGGPVVPDDHLDGKITASDPPGAAETGRRDQGPIPQPGDAHELSPAPEQVGREVKGQVPSTDQIDVTAAIEATEHVREVIQTLARQLDESRQQLEVDRELLEHSREQLRETQQQLDAAIAHRTDVDEQLRKAQSNGHLKDEIRAALDDSHLSALSDEDARSLVSLLESLIESPRDIGVLMNIAEHATAIRRVVDDAFVQQQLLERLRSLVEPT